MRKRLKGYIIIPEIVILLFFLFGCTDPETGVEKSDDITKYACYNDFVEAELNDNYSGFLPTIDIVDRETADYRYMYECAVFGDPNFSIYLKNEFGDNSAFLQESLRLESLAVKKSETDMSTLLVAMPDNSNDIDGYCDNIISDGKFYRIEMALIDSGNYTISYLSAYIQDNYGLTDEIKPFLEAYYYCDQEINLSEFEQIDFPDGFSGCEFADTIITKQDAVKTAASLINTLRDYDYLSGYSLSSVSTDNDDNIWYFYYEPLNPNTDGGKVEGDKPVCIVFDGTSSEAEGVYLKK